MKISRRVALVIVAVGVILLLGLVFQSFLTDTFVTPLALLFWMIWRVLISIDQVYYWGFLIVVFLVYIYVRSPRRSEDTGPASSAAANAVLEAVKYWRLAIVLNSDELGRANLMKNNLGKMLVTIYNLKQPGSSFIDILERMKQKQIDLPEGIYTFLYADEKLQGRRSLVQILRSLRQAPARWIHHFSGRDVADYYQNVTDVIEYMEELMEINHDDTHTDSLANH